FVAAVSIGTFLVNRYSVNIEKATGRRVSETISGMSSQALMLSAGITPMVVYPQAAYSAQAQNAKAALREGAVSQATVAANKSISAYSSQQFAGFERLGRNIGNVVNDVMDGHIATIAEVAQPAVKIVEAEVIADRLAAQRAEFEKFKAKLAAEQADEVKVKAEVEAIKAKVTAQEAAALKPTLIPMGFPVWGTSVVNDPSDATKYLRAGAPLGSKNKNDEGYAFARNGVMAPHAIFLALDVAPSEAMSNINEMLRLYPQIFGKYGAYDSVNAKTGAVSSQYVAVNQAMSFIAMVNYIKDGTIQDRFASNARVSKSLGLLGEKFEKIDDPSGLSLDRDISDKDRKRLNGIAEKTWGYFRDNVNAGTNWLPPNKIDSGVAATYTSVTDIGLYLTSVVGAKEMGFITEAEAKTRIANTINTLKKLDKWNGLFRNYYHTDDLESVTKGDRHISTVDNGWLAAGLIVAGETFPEFKSTADAIVADMKFDSLYDRNERKFANGYDENTGLTKSHYGLIYTEIRPTLLIAIGKGDIGKEAWANTPKTLPEERDWQAQKPDGPYYKHHIDTTEGVKTAYFIPSWDGSMFEGLMPNLYVNNRVFSPNGYAKQDAMYVFLQKYFAKGLDARAPPQIQQAKAETLPAHVKREMPQFADLADALKYARENNTAVASRISAVANFINQGNVIKKVRGPAFDPKTKIIQSALTSLGYELPRYKVDGRFGPETEAAVIKFQKDRGLAKIDGKVGRETITSLIRELLSLDDKAMPVSVEPRESLAPPHTVPMAPAPFIQAIPYTPKPILINEVDGVGIADAKITRISDDIIRQKISILATIINGALKYAIYGDNKLSAESKNYLESNFLSDHLAESIYASLKGRAQTVSIDDVNTAVEKAINEMRPAPSVSAEPIIRSALEKASEYLLAEFRPTSPMTVAPVAGLSEAVILEATRLSAEAPEQAGIVIRREYRATSPKGETFDINYNEAKKLYYTNGNGAWWTSYGLSSGVFDKKDVGTS
ncbi:MAG: peptidoglycan-binding protein, partial [Candidatus Omnitrophica bacterium]|nr:peptidoglycan-binding protein [Candidatus Omnitrophota bacterium]